MTTGQPTKLRTLGVHWKLALFRFTRGLWNPTIHQAAAEGHGKVAVRGLENVLKLTVLPLAYVCES